MLHREIVHEGAVKVQRTYLPTSLVRFRVSSPAPKATGTLLAPPWRRRPSSTMGARRARDWPDFLPGPTSRWSTSSLKLPLVVRPMTEGEFQEKKARIFERNRRRSEERAISFVAKPLRF